MNIYNTPYTYLIGWSNQNKYYYGVRYAKDCHPNDLWNKYFTSSKYVAQLREDHGEPDVVQVRKTFNSSKDACDWETKVLKRLDATHRNDFLNMNVAGAFNLSHKSPEHRAKLSEANKGKSPSKETRAKLKAASTGFKHSEETKAKMSAMRRGVKKSPEHIAKIAATQRSKHLGR